MTTVQIFALILDALLVGIVLLNVILSAKKGFVKVLVEVVGFVAAIALAINISTPLATATYNTFVEPAIIGAVEKNVEATAGESAWEAVPDFITKSADKFGFSLEEFNSTVTSNIKDGAVEAVTLASQQYVMPVAVKVFGLVYSIVLVIILLIVVKLLAKVINKLFSFSLVGKINHTLGGVIGLVKGIVFAVLFCMVGAMLAALVTNGVLIFTAEAISKTFIFKFIISIIPFSIF